MMITILGFPPKTKYQDVKMLIKQECNINDFILDNLVNDSAVVGTKKVRIGLTDNSEGYKVIKCLDGYRMPGNYVLKAVPVGKPATNLPQQGAFDTHMGYQDHPRSDYSAAPRNDYMGQSNTFNNQSPHGSGLHSSAPQVARPTHSQGGHLGPMDMNRPSPWATGNNSSQWNAGPSMASQVPQNTFGGFNSPQANINNTYGQQQHHQNPVHSRPDVRPSFNQARTHTEQTFGGYPPKANMPEVPPRQETRHALRSIETVDTSTASRAPLHGRYPPSQPYQQDKSVTIMKDNFQGPTPYNISNPGAQHTQTGSGGQQYPTTTPSSSPWQSQEYEKRHGFSPRREGITHAGRSLERRPSPSARRISPPGRRISPHARKFSPTGKRPSPDRHVPTHHTAPHPHHPGRRESPHKRPSPMRRLVSPTRRSSPGRRPSPGRRDSPQRMNRYSPDRHHSDKLDKFGQDKLKQIRPAYEPNSHASNQAMYSGGYRSNVRESVQYPMQGVRQGQRISPWQRDEPVALKKQDDDRRDITRMQMSRDRLPDAVVDPKHGIISQRKSRSPVRRERSPLRDRYKRHSPSPRSSHSPRRSWALEKRRSPEIRDAPPPPSWPGQKGREADSFTRTARTFPEREQDEGPKHVPVWQRSFGKDEDPRDRRTENNERRPFIEDKVRPTKDVPVREPVPHPSHSERFVQREPKFSPRNDYEADRRDAYRRREPSVERKPHPQREDYEQARRPREHEERMHSDEYHRRREPSPRHDSRKDDAVNPNIDKDFEEIYKRALQFKKKAEELRRLGSKKRDDYVEDEARSFHSEREREDRSQRYEDRHRYREEEPLRHREREEKPRDDRPRDDRPRDDRPRDDRPRDDRPRDDRPRDDRPRDDRPRDDRPRDDRPRDDRMRDDRPRDDRPRDDRLRDDRQRDDRPRDDRPRDDRPRDDRPRHDTRPDEMRRPPEFRPREEYLKQPEREQDRRFTVNPAIRIKRDKAIEEICKKLLDRHEHYRPTKEEHRARVMEELQLAIARIVFDMFGDKDVAFIEIIIKFQAKYTYKDEEKLLQDVMSSLPSHYRIAKRQAPEPTEVPAKVARHSPSPNIKTEADARPKLSQSRWNVDMLPPELITMPMLGMQPGMTPVLPQGMVPMMVPAPFMHPYKPVSPTPVFAAGPESLQYQEQDPSSDDDVHKLYLCKDDFDQISAHQADLLKEFLISQMIKETQISQGWAPDFTLKGLQNTYRYEILTKDDITRDWLVNLDFNQFEPFHVLAYNKEELWYQRAAVWLPGHSRSRNIEPLDKLKLQNKKLEGANIHTWKYVKKIVTQKGTRLYVDMPPGSARALEKHKMMLSYELQKVNVFLKAVAVDKNVFDAGLKQQSTITPSQISDAIQNSPMPSLSYDPSLVKITLKGCKTLTLTQARKIKEVLIYQLFRYHQQDSSSRTDFIKYGFFPPNSFGVIPQNPETKKWLLSQHLGKVNRQTIIVQGGQDEYTRYFRMTAIVPNENHIVPGIVAERIKQSNQGVKGINFNLWKPIRATSEWKKAMFEVDIDLESLETLSNMRYQLDYVDQSNVTHSVYFKSEHTEAVLEDMIKKYKAEMSDSYDVANMDLDSDSGDDVICLD